MKNQTILILFCVSCSTYGMNDDNKKNPNDNPPVHDESRYYAQLKPLAINTNDPAHQIYDHYYAVSPFHDPSTQHYTRFHSPKNNTTHQRHESQQYGQAPMPYNQNQPATENSSTETKAQKKPVGEKDTPADTKTNICIEVYNKMCSCAHALFAFFDLSQKK